MDKIEDLNYSNIGGEYIPQLCKVGLGNSFSNDIQEQAKITKDKLDLNKFRRVYLKGDHCGS